MPNRLLVTLDRSLLQRARANAADAVRADARNAAVRREAVTALISQPPSLQAGGRPLR